MKQVLLEPKFNAYQIWMDWKQEIVSFHEIVGFEPPPFATLEDQQANIHTLLTAGFRFQS